MDFRTEILRKQMGLDKKKPMPFPIQTIEATLMKREEYSDPRGKMLYSWLYLTGQRIGEALMLRRSDVTTGTLEGNEYIIVASITEKNRITPRRSIPVPLFGREKSAAEECLNSIENLQLDQKIFSVSGTNAWNIVSKVRASVPAIFQDRTVRDLEMKVFPHYMRHCRASHMAMHYGYDLFRLMQFFGWATPMVASIYANMNWQSLAAGFDQTSSRMPTHPL